MKENTKEFILILMIAVFVIAISIPGVTFLKSTLVGQAVGDACIGEVSFNLISTNVIGGVNHVPLVKNDWDKDGKDDVTIRKITNGKVKSIYSSTGVQSNGPSIAPSFITSFADYDGDGQTDGSWYYAPSNTWNTWLSSDGLQVDPAPNFGSVSDIPIPGDYDGDGKDDIAVFKGNHCSDGVKNNDELEIDCGEVCGNECYTGVSGTYNLQMLDNKGTIRDYYLHVPSSYSKNTPMPVLFYFLGTNHAAKGSGTGFKGNADSNGYIFVAPDMEYYSNSVQVQWIRAQQASSDLVDEEFILDVLNRVKTDYRVDTNRVYLTGFSNGAFFSNLMIMRYPYIFAAVAPHSGGNPPSTNANLASVTRKYSVKFFEEANDVQHLMDDVDDAIDDYEAYNFPVQLYRSGTDGHNWDSSMVPLIWSFLSSKRVN